MFDVKLLYPNAVREITHFKKVQDCAKKSTLGMQSIHVSEGDGEFCAWHSCPSHAMLSTSAPTNM
jgi:hypothetical protein